MKHYILVLSKFNSPKSGKSFIKGIVCHVKPDGNSWYDDNCIVLSVSDLSAYNVLDSYEVIQQSFIVAEGTYKNIYTF